MEYLVGNIKKFPSVAFFPIRHVRGIKQTVVVSDLPGRCGIFWRNEREDAVEHELLAPYTIRSVKVVEPATCWEESIFELQMLEVSGTPFRLHGPGCRITGLITARMFPHRARGLFAAVGAILDQTRGEIWMRSK
mgnify:CR=1 FL=1